MNVPVHCGNYHSTFFRDLSLAGQHKGLDFLEGTPGGLRTHEQLGQIDRFFFKSFAHQIQRRDDFGLHDLQRIHGGQQFLCGVGCLCAKSLYNRFLQCGFCVFRRGSRDSRGGGSGRDCLGECRRKADVVPAVIVQTVQRTIGIPGLHHGDGIRIHDGGGQTVFQRQCKEGAVHPVSVRQAEGNVGYAQGGVAAQSVPDLPEGTKSCQRRTGVRTDGHGEGVKNDILFVDPVFCGTGENFFGNGHPSFRRFRDAVFVQRQGNCHTAVLFQQGEDGVHAFFLAVHRVDQRFPVDPAQGTFHGDRVGGVDLQRKIQNGLQFTGHRFQQSRFVYFRQTYVHVQNVRSLFLLPDSFI